MLAFIGVHLLRGAIFTAAESRRLDPSRGLALVAVSTASSLDALAAGLSLAMLHVGSLPASPVIGLPPAVEAWLAFFLERVT